MLPLLHMKHRNFFDNDEVDEEDDLDLTDSSNYITALIKEEVEAMSRLSLQNDLKKDGSILDSTDPIILSPFKTIVALCVGFSTPTPT